MKRHAITIPMLVWLAICLLGWVHQQAPTRPPIHGIHPLLLIGLFVFACGPFVWLVITVWPKDD
jgi:hypothetical protein